MVKKDKIEQGRGDLKEILGDIKTVVSGEKETLFKVSEYKTIKLKKENLVTAGLKRYPSGLNYLDDKKLEGLIRKIVRSELKSFQFNNKFNEFKLEKKRKTGNGKKNTSGLELLTKTVLLSLSKENNLSLSSKNTKAEIIKELKENKIKAP